MPKVRGGKDKWQRNASAATGDYQDGVANPRAKWDEATAAAATSYEQGVQKAIANKSFAKGVKAAGHETWQQATLNKGPARFAEGVRQGADTYEKGFEPYRKVIESTNLPARGPRGSEGNYQRAVTMGKALADARAKKA